MGGRFRIGTAGWSIPREWGDEFPAEGTHLARYAQRLPAVEINSSFHRPHRAATYARWAASVPAGFRFAVKAPREVTHARRLVGADEPMQRFLGEAGTLGAALGPVLVQLPPSLQFDRAVAEQFFGALRERFEGGLACEPRHPTWFEDEADELLVRFKVARVAADPAVTPRGAGPGGWPGLAYWRLHGAPRVYYSEYGSQEIAELAGRLQAVLQAAECWCVFDNTTLGKATGNALDLLARIVPAGA